MQAERRIVERRRFTVEEYHKMAEGGIFREDERVELIDGEVVKRNPIGWRHARCVSRLTTRLVRAAGDRYAVGIQSPITLSSHGEPQPDLVIYNEPTPGCLPGPKDVLLVEVSDSTLPYDRKVKLPRYAHACIPELCIADLQGEAVELYNGPRARVRTSTGASRRQGGGRSWHRRRCPGSSSP